MKQNINDERRSWYVIKVYFRARAWEPFDEAQPYGGYVTNKRVNIGDYAVVRTKWGIKIGVVCKKQYWRPSLFRPNQEPKESSELLTIVKDVRPYQFLGYKSPRDEEPFDERKYVIDRAIQKSKRKSEKEE